VSRVWRFAPIGLAALVVIAVGIYALVPSERGADVPTVEVRHEAFERWVPAEGELRAAESTPLQVPGTVRRPMRIAWLAPEGTYLQPGDVAVRFDPTELQKTVADQRSELASNRLEVQQRTSEMQAKLQSLDKDAEMARRELQHAKEFASRDPTIFSRVEIIESQIDQELAGERLESSLLERRREEEVAATDLEILAITRRRIEGDLGSALETLASLELQAPKAGHLIYHRRRGQPPEVGNTVFPGQTVGEIPHDGAMEVEAFVLEADAGGLDQGRPARVYPEARPGTVLDATVTRVDSVAKPRFRASPVQYFAVTLALSEDDSADLKPGLGARVEILLDDIEDALTVPRQAVFNREAGTVVLRRTGNGFEEVPVTVRATGRGRVVIEGAVAAGEWVAMADPSRRSGERGGDEGDRPGGGAPVPGGAW